MRHIESRRQRRQSKQGRQGTGKAGTYQVAYQTVGHLLSGPNGKPLTRLASKRLQEAPRLYVGLAFVQSVALGLRFQVFRVCGFPTFLRL